MARCNSVLSDLTALVDDELPRFRAWRVRHHLARCSGCQAHADEVSQAIAAQATVLRRAVAADVATDLDSLRRRVRIAIAAEPDPVPSAIGSGFLSWRPMVLACAALVLGLGVGLWGSGSLTTTMVAIGVMDPPSAVARKPDLFRDYPLIRDLDALENFDRVNSEPVDESDESSSLEPAAAG